MTFNMKKLVIILHLCFVFPGCATRYKQMTKNDGYKDHQIGNGRYYIQFVGNIYTSDIKTYQMFLKRCAEITINNNYKYFEIVDKEVIEKNNINRVTGTTYSNNKITTNLYSGENQFTPSIQKTTHKHIIEGVISLYNETDKPLNAYEAKNIINQ